MHEAGECFVLRGVGNAPRGRSFTSYHFSSRPRFSGAWYRGYKTPNWMNLTITKPPFSCWLSLTTWAVMSQVLRLLSCSDFLHIKMSTTQPLKTALRCRVCRKTTEVTSTRYFAWGLNTVNTKPQLQTGRCGGWKGEMGTQSCCILGKEGPGFLLACFLLTQFTPTYSQPLLRRLTDI